MKKQKRIQHVLINASTLAACFGLKVVCATPLKTLDQDRDTSAIEGMIARSIQMTSESLMRLRRLLREAARQIPEDRREQWEAKARQHFSDVQLTYNRIAESLETDDSAVQERIELFEIFDRAASDVVPMAKRSSWLTTELPFDRITVLGVPGDLAHVFKSILKFLHQEKPDDQRVKVQFASKKRGDRRFVSVQIKARSEQMVFKGMDALKQAYQVATALAELDEPWLRRIIEDDHFGSYGKKYSDAWQRYKFDIELPVADLEVADDARYRHA
ncbi:MAG: hypothetical protein AAGC57_14840 [Pseudomonadota bacterium]